MPENGNFEAHCKWYKAGGLKTHFSNIYLVFFVTLDYITFKNLTFCIYLFSLSFYVLKQVDRRVLKNHELENLIPIIEEISIELKFYIESDLFFNN